MGCVVHGGQAGPIIRPAIHVLLMAGLYKLNLSQRPTVGELFDEKKLARIDNCFGHHVAQACLLNQIHDCFAFFQARCHRHRAHHMLAGSERSNRHWSMVWNGCVEMHSVNIRIVQNIGIVLVAPLDAVGCADLIEFFPRPLADGEASGVRMLLVDRNKLSTKTEANDGDCNGTNRGGGHQKASLRNGCRHRGGIRPQSKRHF